MFVSVHQLFTLFSHTAGSVFVCVAEPLSSVSSLEVHFDLLDLTELTDMSDQELAEVFVDSDDENHNEPRAGEPQRLETLLLLPLLLLFLLLLRRALTSKLQCHLNIILIKFC